MAVLWLLLLLVPLQHYAMHHSADRFVILNEVKDRAIEAAALKQSERDRFVLREIPRIRLG